MYVGLEREFVLGQTHRDRQNSKHKFLLRALRPDTVAAVALALKLNDNLVLKGTAGVERLK